MPNEGETRPCTVAHCKETQTLTPNAPIAGSNYVITTDHGVGATVHKPALAWLCKNREHYEIVQM